MSMRCRTAQRGALVLATLALAGCATTSPPSTGSTGRTASFDSRPPSAPIVSSQVSTPVAASTSALPSATSVDDTVSVPLHGGVSMLVSARVESDGNRYDGTPGVSVVAAAGQTVLGVSFGFILSPPGPVTLTEVWGVPGEVAVLAPPAATADAGLPCTRDPLNPQYCRIGPMTTDPPTGYIGTSPPYGEGNYLAAAVPRALDLHTVRVAFETPQGVNYPVPTRYADPGRG